MLLADKAIGGTGVAGVAAASTAAMRPLYRCWWQPPIPFMHAPPLRPQPLSRGCQSDHYAISHRLVRKTGWCEGPFSIGIEAAVAE